MHDVTERRRAERDLRLHKFFSDQSPDPYYLANKSGKLTYVNRSACDRLGYTGSELLALGLAQAAPESGLDRSVTCSCTAFASAGLQ
jgi:PAS domain S-box-containing protein